jgi:hypothetical protein
MKRTNITSQVRMTRLRTSEGRIIARFASHLSVRGMRLLRGDMRILKFPANRNRRSGKKLYKPNVYTIKHSR